MATFGKTSKERLSTCEDDLQTLLSEVVKTFDCIILEGHRSTERQNRLYKEGKSKIDGVNRKGKHNYYPSKAVDVAPYFSSKPHVRWNETNTFYWFAGYVMGIAQKLYEDGKITHRIRSGADWNGDKDITNQSFNDIVHFEIKG